ncbi:MAG: undecaprenyldiphospho-muramoylpentapeptide beta-N-acetylglucosaminyltransferase [Gammaproteobacteria bacterium]|nr:undecaprenyldiphospho-muramoylpentapeptide beta-N-acetylglucosaminyltransferase [Gammaproteobacteria bacterium]
MTQLKRVLIMAGGTGGHVFPGLAVAKELQKQHTDVLWLGTEKGIEAQLIPDAHIPLRTISISGVRGKKWQTICLAPFLLLHAIYSAARIIRKYQPDVVLGFGGFVSGPGGIASWLLRYPLVIHEQNAKVGTTNRWLARVAKNVLQAFPHVFSERVQARTVGNPLRDALIHATHEKAWPTDRPLHLLVLGGSLGAAALNEIVPQAVAAIPAPLRPLVRHQSGEKHFSDTMRHWQAAGVTADVKSFIQDMAEAYAWADIVLCRAGALTITELCAVGRGAILVPYPFAIDDHQTANAEVMVKNNAAILLKQSQLSVNLLTENLLRLIESPEDCQLMAQAAYQLRETNALEKIVRVCEESCH